VTGVPLSVINTPYIERMGTAAGPIGRFMLKGRRTKHLMRAIYSLRSAWTLKEASIRGASSSDCWQAGKSVASIESIEPAAAIVKRLAAA
jgi:nitronate monooxygenase